MNNAPVGNNISKVRFYVDSFFFLLMVLVLVPQTTGIPTHEWVSFFIIIPFLLHLTINWNWISTNSSKFFNRQLHKKLFDYFLNWLLYVLMMIVTVSGIVISESALPSIGIHFTPNHFWSTIHDISANLLMATLGVHIALHWKWILGVFKHFKFKADLHNLSEIKVILKKHYRSLLLIIVVSVVLSFIIWTLNYTTWAEDIRLNSGQHKEKGLHGESKGWLRFILPLVKVTLFITIPALITTYFIKLKSKFNWFSKA